MKGQQIAKLNGFNYGYGDYQPDGHRKMEMEHAYDSSKGKRKKDFQEKIISHVTVIKIYCGGKKNKKKEKKCRHYDY
ncbi:hypothetical protein [Peribacillus kribbensis]|uniref:hypothetical protein n=1 Tax=Peribacillus kribbensis TaxID=356658 RepID=UPI00047D6BD2|nr:hypothetical protein [Peribacillus kribbensis]